MANETFRLDAEFVVDASQAIKNFQNTEKSARSLMTTLVAAGTALEDFNKQSKKKGGVSLLGDNDDTKNLERTLKVYKQLADVASSYGRALQNLNGVDGAKGQQRLESSLKGVAKALASVGKMTKEDAEATNRTLSVYKQIVDTHLKRTQALKAETDALKKKNKEEVKAQGGKAVDSFDLVNQAKSTNTNDAQRARAAHQLGKLQDAAYKEDRKRTEAAEAAARKRFETERNEIAKTAAASKALAAQRDKEYEARARGIMRATGLLDRDQAAAKKAADLQRQNSRAQAEAQKAATVWTQHQAKSIEDVNKAHAGTRYALYDVAGAYGAVAAAASAAAVGAAAVAVQYERQFADVSRTTMADPATLAAINEEFLNLSTSIPVTYEELTKIGTIGAQMGVAEDDLGSFAKTVSIFSMTTNAGVNETAMAFGRLDNMLADVSATTYPQLASAIAEVGTASVATETEILTISESIATTAGMAGFTADQVVGLSTALASLKVRPELARGAMQRIFAGINKAVGEGGEDLTAYATAIGVTEKEFSNLWRSNPSEAFQRIAESLSDMTDNVERDIAIRQQLGITNTRDVEMLSRLANGYETYEKSMTLASEAYQRGDFLDEASARIFETTAATLVRLGNAFKEFLATFGGGALEPIKATSEALIGILDWATSLPEWLQRDVLALIAIVGAVAAFKAALALATAGMIAFRQVLGDAGMQGGVSIANLRRQFALLRGDMAATTAQAGGVATSLRMMDAHMNGTSVAATRLRGGLGLVTGMLGGPWGIALAGASIGLGYLITKNAEAKQHVDELTASLDQQTGALTENTRETVYNAFNKDGTVEVAKRAGVALDDLVTAAIDPTSEAYKELRARADEANAELAAAHETGNLSAVNAVTQKHADLWEVLQQVGIQQDLIADAQEELNDKQAAGVETAGLLGAETEEMGDEFEGAATDVDALTEALDAAMGKMFNIIDAQAGMQAALQALGESMAENGTDFTVNTEEGRANLAELQSAVESFSAYMQAEVEAGNMTADEAALRFAHYVESLLLQLEQMGVDPKQFVDFRNVLGEIFENNPVAVNVNTEAALANLQNLAAYGAAVFNALNGNIQGTTNQRGWAASGARYSAQAAAHNARNGKATTGHGITVNPPPKQVTSPWKPLDYAALAYGNAAREAEILAEKNEEAAKSAKKAGEQTKSAAEQHADYIKRLGEAMDASFNRRYGIADARDAVEMQLITMRERIDDAKESMKDLREEQRKLNQEAADARIEARQADIFAGVARQYGDTERYLDYSNQAESARATVAEKTRLASAAGKEASELEKNYMALTGYSKSAIENRAAVRTLQNEMQTLILAYAESGATTEEVAAYTDLLRRRFRDQLTQMGYNERQVEDLSDVFVDLKRDIDRVPRHIKIKAEADTAEAQRRIRELGKGVTAPITFEGKNQNIGIDGNLNVNDVRAKKLDAMEVTYGRHFAQGLGGSGGITRARGGVIPGRASSKYQDNLIATGHNYDGLVTVRSGEGIVNQPALAHYGGPAWLDAVNNMRLPQFTAPVAVSSGGGNSSHPQLVEILPHQIQQIAAAVSTVLAVDGNLIAQTTNNKNVAAARRGSN